MEDGVLGLSWRLNARKLAEVEQPSRIGLVRVPNLKEMAKNAPETTES